MVTALKLRGPFTGPSGYDHHVREFARAIANQGVAIELENMPEWGPVQLPHNLRDPWFESLSQPVDARTTVHFSFPEQVVRVGRQINVNYTMFEATRIPARWVAAHGRSDLIAVPTEHSRRAWIDSGVPESKLRLSPLGVRSDLYRPGVRPLDLSDKFGRQISTYATRFLNVSELDIRKNFQGLLGAWLRATTSTDDAVLILKAGFYNPGSLAALEWELEQVQAQTGKRLAQAAPIHFIHDLYPDADMPRLFAAATHYVSLSFGEGWDLSMIEAAASGLRLIAPRHSAYLAYLDDDVAAMVSAVEVPAVTFDGSWAGQLFDGASWWVPDEDEAVQRIRDAIDGRDTPSASARERVAGFTWDNAAARLLEIVDEAEAMTS